HGERYPGRGGHRKGSIRGCRVGSPWSRSATRAPTTPQLSTPRGAAPDLDGGDGGLWLSALLGETDRRTRSRSGLVASAVREALRGQEQDRPDGCERAPGSVSERGDPDRADPDGDPTSAGNAAPVTLGLAWGANAPDQRAEGLAQGAGLLHP